MIKHSTRYFKKQPVRAIWEKNQAQWWYSAVDLTRILLDSKEPRKYWNIFKDRNPELSSFCRQLKLYALDGKKYASDVINEGGTRLFLTLISNKHKKDVLNWLNGMMDPLDEQSKQKAYELYNTDLIQIEEVGKVISLQKIHGYLFEGLYPFAGKIRTKNISKDGFVFANSDFLSQILKSIDEMPEVTLDDIVRKYVEMNIAHPFMEGNGRATRIWLDLILKKQLRQCIDWSKIEKKKYFEAMIKSPVDASIIRKLLFGALTNDLDNRELFLKGIDTSYYYEEIDE
jgi:cell filamentation protein